MTGSKAIRRTFLPLFLLDLDRGARGNEWSANRRSDYPVRDRDSDTPRSGAALPLLELQAFVASFALTALYLGMMVDERQRAAGSLRRNLRLAAAGEMAGALAHELNQPLTALANYGRSAQLILAAGGKALDQLPDVIEQMLAEGLRAGEVVRRLRDFFRAGTTRLEFVPVEQILSAARNIAQHISGQEKVAITTRAEDELPPLFVDRMQIELTLRNLIANAFEAVADRKDGSAQISVTAQRHDPQNIRITVADNGPGMPLLFAIRYSSRLHRAQRVAWASDLQSAARLPKRMAAR